ncbi:MAG: TetR family transcriptional regulator, partial [Pararhodobacter sp.]|nr:TetR family transcriptional regulator [Pararhodobacter sp.]
PTLPGASPRSLQTRLPAADRRALILAAAARLLWERGEAGATMREIGQESGVLMSTLYYYYRSKDHLIRAVHEAGVQRIRERVELACAHQSDPWARVRAAAVAHLEAILDPDPFFRVVQMPLPRISGELRKTVIVLRDSYEDIQRRLVAELPLRPEVDRSLFRLGLIGMLNAVPNWYRPGGSATPADIATGFVELLRRGSEQEPGAR